MVSFVILHYKNINDTIECLEKIISLNFKTYSMVVVDNNSLLVDEETLIKNYTNDVVKLDKNYGFAKANNQGVLYAINKYNPDFICVINNDILITQSDFINIIKEDFTKYNFDMIGPKIFSPSGESINPFPALISEEQVQFEISKCNKLIKIYSSIFLTNLLNIYLKIKHLIIKPIEHGNGIEVSKNIPLHCCAIIFSKKYFNSHKDVFDNRTFLFHEEDLLYQRVLNEKLISLYDPRLEVYHKEGGSINKENKTKRLSKLFRETERLKSLKILLNTIKEHKYEKAKD